MKTGMPRTGDGHARNCHESLHDSDRRRGRDHALLWRSPRAHPRRAADAQFSRRMALRKRPADPARHRWPAVPRVESRGDRSHGVHGGRTRRDDREARGTRASLRLPAAPRPWHVAAFFPRSEWRPHRNGLRRRRDAMTEVRRSSPSPAQLDHLVVAATTLADGIEYIAELTGVAAQPGGKHVTMGTHNALLRLGERVYLEIIAIDPDGIKPLRPRWFDLDDIALQSELTERPQLVHWVARTTDIERAAAACPVPLGAITPAERGDYRWRITIPDDGKRPGNGIIPTLIQWDVPMHPADRLPSSNVSIAQIA